MTKDLADDLCMAVSENGATVNEIDGYVNLCPCSNCQDDPLATSVPGTGANVDFVSMLFWQ